MINLTELPLFLETLKPRCIMVNNHIFPSAMPLILDILDLVLLHIFAKTTTNLLGAPETYMLEVSPSWTFSPFTRYGAGIEAITSQTPNFTPNQFRQQMSGHVVRWGNTCNMELSTNNLSNLLDYRYIWEKLAASDIFNHLIALASKEQMTRGDGRIRMRVWLYIKAMKS